MTAWDLSTSPFSDLHMSEMHTNQDACASRTSDWLAYLEEEMAAAAAAMESELGERSLCTVHRDGRVTGGLKYQEGRLNALAEARRLARHPSDIGAALAAQKQKWGDELDRRRNASPPSMTWVSYATGGVDATEDALEAFHRTLRPSR